MDGHRRINAIKGGGRVVHVLIIEPTGQRRSRTERRGLKIATTTADLQQWIDNGVTVTVTATDDQSARWRLLARSLKNYATVFAVAASMLASRAMRHLPPCFFNTDNVYPDRVIDGAPPGGVATTVSLVHMNAQSPNTSTS